MQKIVDCFLALRLLQLHVVDDFARGLVVALQGLELHEERGLDSEDGVVREVLAVLVEDLGCDGHVFVVSGDEMDVSWAVGMAVEELEDLSGRAWVIKSACMECAT